MKSATPILLATLCFLLATQTGADVDRSTTLRGDYVWTGSDRGELEAVFTPTAKGRWDVAFHFRFSGQPRVFRGTAEGGLGEGDLEGTVRNESERRTFTFRGSFENGRFRGIHAEVRRGRERETGTLTLRSERSKSSTPGRAP